MRGGEGGEGGGRRWCGRVPLTVLRLRGGQRRVEGREKRGLARVVGRLRMGEVRACEGGRGLSRGAGGARLACCELS